MNCVQLFSIVVGTKNTFLCMVLFFLKERKYYGQVLCGDIEKDDQSRCVCDESMVVACVIAMII